MSKSEHGSIWCYPSQWKEKDSDVWQDITSKVDQEHERIQLEKWLVSERQAGEYYLLLYSYSREEFIIVTVSGDPDTRSLYRMVRRLTYNSAKFEYFVTLTFPDKSEGIYPDGSHFKNKFTLSKIRFEMSFGSYMRKFWNRVQQNRRNNKKKFPDSNVRSDLDKELMNYFWKYEQGSETNRPHVHAFIGNVSLRVPFIDSFRPIFKVMNGKTELVDGYIPPVPVKLHDELMNCWQSGYIHISPISSDGVKKYAGKYFSKKGNINKRGRSRRWGTSWGISSVPKSDDILFIDKGSDFDYLLELKHIIDVNSYVPYGTPSEK